jgi:excisionase family DNA binding protein
MSDDSAQGLSAEVAVQLHTIAEAARLLRVPEGWLRKKVTAGLVPHTRIGKHVRFTNDHLRRVIDAGEAQLSSPPDLSPQGLSPRARRTRPAI